MRDVEWESSETRQMTKTEKEDFIGKCEIIYPTFVTFLKKKRAESDESHDVDRRALYDAVVFRATDNEFFAKKVLSAVARHAFEQKLMVGFTKVEQYFDILAAAHREACRARKISNKKNHV